MTPDDALRSCPCGSRAPLSACCGVYLDRQQNPPTAETLMRSRYTAFVQRDAEYLLATWDPGHRPAQLDLKKDRTEWLGLQILATEAGRATDSQGRVSFVAHFRLDGSAQARRENSRFRKVAGRWLYIDGQVLPAPLLEPRAVAARPDVGRNDPCPCGSGQKYKRCCGK